MYAKLLGGITRLGIGGEERQGSREVEGGRIQWEDQLAYFVHISVTLAEATGCILAHLPALVLGLGVQCHLTSTITLTGGSLGPFYGKDKALSRGCGPMKAPRIEPSAEALRKRLPTRTAFPAVWRAPDKPVTPAALSDRPQERLRKISRLLSMYIMHLGTVPKDVVGIA